MIYHFVKRDLISYRVFWALMGVAALATLPILFTPSASLGFGFLAYLYFFFALIPIQNLTGVTWRSQHVMSRSYLLSLPVSRRKLFMLIQLRAAVFALPLFLVLAAVPFGLPWFGTYLARMGIAYPAYLVAIGAFQVWTVNQHIDMQLQFERITTYISMHRRAIAWVKILLFNGIDLLFFLPLLVWSAKVPSVVLLLPILTIVGFRFLRVRAAWIGA